MLDGVFTIPFPGPFPSGEPVLSASFSRGGPLGEFIAGPENQLAVATVLAVAFQQETGDPLLHAGGPLVFSGPTGSGKSHLASVLAHELRRRDSTTILRHLLAAEYAREFSLAIDTQAVSEWENRYRKCDVLIVEDLDHLTAKQAPQEHLARTIDVLCRRGALIIVTSATHPAAINHLTAPLRSRLSGGLVIPLALPGVAARKRILERLASRRQLPITRQALELLANDIPGGARELQGALVFLQAASRDLPIDPGKTAAIDEQEVVCYLADRRAATTPTLVTIAGQTARYFGLKLNKLRGPSRHQNLAMARNIAMYLARRLTGQSYATIGAFFGGRDHTTAMHACRRVVQLAEGDPATQRALVELHAALGV